MIQPFKAEHLSKIKLQHWQASAQAEFANPDYGKVLENSYAYSLVDGDTVLCSAGIMDIWPGRAMAWALVGEDAGKRFFEIHRNVSAALRLHPAKRIEMAVHVDFKEAHRWAKLLGMHCECDSMQAYAPDGSNHSLYVRIKD